MRTESLVTSADSSSRGTRSASGALQIAKLLKRFRIFRKRYRAYLLDFQKHNGNCYACAVPDYLVSDKEGRSTLVLYEDSVPLPFPHAIHSDIESMGAGRYSHWQGWILFSTSDNSDPNSNGRVYSVREM